ncbi:MAG: tRNA glutamyl-Q(34) synthetase GluQRS [Pseudomonadota bacterium]
MINLPSVFRFAPSPNGQLHLGHAYSALLNYQLAMEAGGRFLVRVEDIDQTRCTPELERAMLRDLAWLGLKWEEPVRRQSMHFGEFAKALQSLEALGLTYRSQLSRGDVRRIVEAHEKTGKAWPRDPDGAPLFPGQTHELDAADADNNFAIRLKTQAAIEHIGGPFEWQELVFGGTDKMIESDPKKWGDVVLARRDTPTSYHLSVVVDDAIQGVSHIVRGSDLYEATGMHILLQKLLGLPKPLYHHHALILGENGQKLSKSKNGTSIAQLRQAGATPNEIRQMVGL